MLLLTGFEPFDGDTLNPSRDLAFALEGRRVGGWQVHALELPCRFDRAPAVLDAALARLAPSAVLAIGQAGGRAELSFERVAINLVDARIADNGGLRPAEAPVVAGAPAAYFARWPVKAMAAAARAAGVPAAVSYSAGTFVCNQVFFHLMHRLAGPAAALRGGFLHVPWLPAQAARVAGRPSLDQATMQRGLLAALGAAAGLKPEEDPGDGAGRLD
ncbi:pyrrolidone-carboxylate peptidase [Piscinibacter sakaiensis]|uniref:Pyroglutamyl-peptidase I n=1 Tax=Piscinibacter sakaiensis TaxID=1547922 RepID=A0A0K8P301_PISS1|nr:pyrrolidone-carboxylate peptidase [Piscinibacter sakaiensis]